MVANHCKLVPVQHCQQELTWLGGRTSLEEGLRLIGPLVPGTLAWLSMFVMPFTTAEPTGVLCCPSMSVRADESLSGSIRRIDASVGLASSLEIAGVRYRPDIDVAWASGWLLEEFPRWKGISDDRCFSFFIFSGDGTGGGAAFFLLPITVPRRLLRPCFLGVSLVSESLISLLWREKPKNMHLK